MFKHLSFMHHLATIRIFTEARNSNLIALQLYRNYTVIYYILLVMYS